LPSAVARAIRSPGDPLDPAIRARLEPSLGADLGDVRVHTDGTAAESARAVDARAYTVGRDVVFGPGGYRPDTPAGLGLLSHELAHVVQQGGGPGAPSPAPRGAAEREADAVSRAVESGGPAGPVHVRSGVGLARQMETINPALASDERLATEHRRLQEWLGSHTAADPEYEPTMTYLRAIEEEVARRSQPKPPSDPAAPGSPPVVPPDRELVYLLQPLPEAPPPWLAATPDGQIVTAPDSAAPAASAAPEQTGTPAGGIMAGGAAGTLAGANQALMAGGFASVPGGNSIGLVGIPRLGTAGAAVPESLSAWGHTAVVLRLNGQIVAVRGYTVGSLAEAALNPLQVPAGQAAIPATVSNDIGLFTNTGARSIEWPTSAENVRALLNRLPPEGPPPASGPTLYTGRPALFTGQGTAANCVGWACSQIEPQLGGRVGTTGPGGTVEPLTEPVNPAEGLQGRFMKLAKGAAENPESVAPMAEATGAPVAAGMSRGMQFVKWGGRVFLVVGAVLTIREIVTAEGPHRRETEGRAFGAFAGGTVVGAFGAGLCIGLGIATGGLALIGCGLVAGIGGALAGGAIGGAVGRQFD
jgi:hypothetical protein